MVKASDGVRYRCGVGENESATARECRPQARGNRRIRRNVGFFLSEQLIIFTVIFPDTFLKSVA
ncbi:hypothetical protein FQY86_11505 [Cronobacter sakazakii]|nr:hypothetical protein CDU02_04430 [Cronobacter sakazakii]TWR38308.1 hypothetical protein FQY86_11505 [Cronobacter sakazakii]